MAFGVSDLQKEMIKNKFNFQNISFLKKYFFLHNCEENMFYGMKSNGSLQKMNGHVLWHKHLPHNIIIEFIELFGGGMRLW